ncbi:MAG: hypothetical protein AB8B59_02330 [Maribacter sp.]
MKATLLFLISFLPLLSGAQQHMEITGGLNGTRLYVENVDNSKYDAIDGSPYLSEEFVTAKINDVEKTQFIRFNVFDNIIEVQMEDKKTVMLNLENEIDIKLLDGSKKQYRTASYLKDGTKSKSFFEVINDGDNYSLYKQERKLYQEEQEAEAFKEKQRAKFVARSPIFFVTDFNSDSPILLEVPKKKKKFITLFGKKGKEVEKYMKQKKLNFKEKDDLVQIMDFISSDG